LNSKISDKDKKDWENFLSSDENLPDKDFNLKKKIKKIVTFDLHGYSLDEANIKIKNLIYDSYNKKVGKLIIVTGKGLHSQNEKDPYTSKDLGILKHSVPDYIKNNNELMSMINSIEDANVQDGGSGAFYIYLKKKSIK
tara:strand:- start:422 stop:838 length:417 start_codon:yes stop_codon:yes gene_type:complete